MKDGLQQLIPRVPGLSLVAGDFSTCMIAARLDDSTKGGPVAGAGVRCWGSSENGQIGNRQFEDLVDEAPEARMAVEVEGLNQVTALTGGADFTCATQNGRLYCWGIDLKASCVGGRPEHVIHSVPDWVETVPTPVTAVASGFHHVCAISNGVLYCTGKNTDGALGAPTKGRTCFAEHPFKADGGVVAVTALGDQTCVTTGSGKRFCTSDEGFTAATAGPTKHDERRSQTSRARRLDTRTILVQGKATRLSDDQAADYTSQLGLHIALAPVVRLLTGLLPRFRPWTAYHFAENVIDFAVGAEHFCAALESGTVQCSGSNAKYQLGDERRSATLAAFHESPVTVRGILPTIRALAAGPAETCALVNEATRCWRQGENARLVTSSRGWTESLSVDWKRVCTTSGTGSSCAGLTTAPFFRKLQSPPRTPGTLGAPAGQLVSGWFFTALVGADSFRCVNGDSPDLPDRCPQPPSIASGTRVAAGPRAVCQSDATKTTCTTRDSKQELDLAAGTELLVAYDFACTVGSSVTCQDFEKRNPPFEILKSPTPASSTPFLRTWAFERTVCAARDAVTVECASLSSNEADEAEPVTTRTLDFTGTGVDLRDSVTALGRDGLCAVVSTTQEMICLNARDTLNTSNSQQSAAPRLRSLLGGNS